MVAKLGRYSDGIYIHLFCFPFAVDGEDVDVAFRTSEMSQMQYVY